jgi:hypothetical protein
MVKKALAPVQKTDTGPRIHDSDRSTAKFETGSDTLLNQLIFLQRTVGNQAVGNLMRPALLENRGLPNQKVAAVSNILPGKRQREEQESPEKESSFLQSEPIFRKSAGNCEQNIFTQRQEIDIHPGNDAPASRTPNLGVTEIPNVGVRVDRVGIINRDRMPEVRMRSAPDTSGDNVITTLPFNTHVQVIRQLPGDWSFVATPAGEMGYVASEYIWTNLPEPNARLHRVQSGIPGTAIAIAERYFQAYADDWGQDLRFYVNVLAFSNNIQVPNTRNGWRQVRFQSNDLIWIPSPEFARGLRGTVNSGSISYEFARSLGVASFIERAGQLWDDLRRAVSLSRRYLAQAIARHGAEAIRNALLSLAIMLVAAVAILAISTAVGAAIGALAGGVGAAPGAAAGFEVGMVILEWLGLAMLVVWIGTVLYQVGRAFAQFFSTVWDARGNERILDRAAREFADAIGVLIGAIIEALLLLAASYGIGRAAGLLRNTRFGRSMSESRFGEWFRERVRNFREGRAPIRRPAEVFLRFFRNVEIVDANGAPLGEFDAINMNRRMFLEDKSAQGLHIINPRTGRPQQTPAQWARRQILQKTDTRIRNLANATATRPAGGSPSVPTLAEIQGFRRLRFRIDGDTPALRAAVMAELASLRSRFPGWEFSVEFGVNIAIPPVPIPESERAN